MRSMGKSFRMPMGAPLWLRNIMIQEISRCLSQRCLIIHHRILSYLKSLILHGTRTVSLWTRTHTLRWAQRTKLPWASFVTISSRSTEFACVLMQFWTFQSMPIMRQNLMNTGSGSIGFSPLINSISKLKQYSPTTRTRTRSRWKLTSKVKSTNTFNSRSEGFYSAWFFSPFWSSLVCNHYAANPPRKKKIKLKSINRELFHWDTQLLKSPRCQKYLLWCHPEGLMPRQ